MSATSFTCKCGHDQEIEYETDGYRVLDVWSVDGELTCEVCGEALDRDAVYAKVSEDYASDLADGPNDNELISYYGNP